MEWIKKYCYNNSLGNGHLMEFDYDALENSDIKVQEKIYAKTDKFVHINMLIYLLDF